MTRVSLLAAVAAVLFAGQSFAAETTEATLRKKQEQLVPPNSLGGLAVRLQQDGTLVGVIGYIDPNKLDLVPIPDFEFRFVQNRQTMARGRSGPDGRLVVRGLSPLGVYSLVGGGELDGQRWMIACGISVFPPEGQGVGDTTGASARRGTGARTKLAAATRRYLSVLEQFAQAELAACACPTGDGGVGGGAAGFLDGGILGGGAGGGGGGGGLPGGLAAMAALAALASTDDNQAASPFRTNGN